jgi:uncharacterized membrane protein
MNYHKLLKWKSYFLITLFIIIFVSFLLSFIFQIEIIVFPRILIGFFLLFFAPGYLFYFIVSPAESNVIKKYLLIVLLSVAISIFITLVYNVIFSIQISFLTALLSSLIIIFLELIIIYIKRRKT